VVKLGPGGQLRRKARQDMAAEILLTGGEVAKLLNISRSSAYGLMRCGSLRVVRMNRSVRVRPTDLERFIAAHCDPEPPEVRGNGGVH
jgi:excisionase family DNA binding protein